MRSLISVPAPRCPRVYKAASADLRLLRLAVLKFLICVGLVMVRLGVDPQISLVASLPAGVLLPALRIHFCLLIKI